jgi:hypothetical protein
MFLWSELFLLSHHQPINVPTAEAQCFLIDYTQGERAITGVGADGYFGLPLVPVYRLKPHDSPLQIWEGSGDVNDSRC